MKVVIFGNTYDIDEEVMMERPETVPVLVDVKKAVEEDFFILFNRNLDIVNWNYIIIRGFVLNLIQRVS